MKTKFKNSLKTGLAVLSLLWMTSCSDLMDTQPFDKFSEDVVWSNKTNTDAFFFAT